MTVELPDPARSPAGLDTWTIRGETWAVITRDEHGDIQLDVDGDQVGTFEPAQARAIGAALIAAAGDVPIVVGEHWRNGNWREGT